MTSVKGWHTGILWSMTLSASLRTVVMCFSLLHLPYYINPSLDLGKNTQNMYDDSCCKSPLKKSLLFFPSDWGLLRRPRRVLILL